MRTVSPSRGDRHPPWRLPALLAASLLACPGGPAGAEVPSGLEAGTILTESGARGGLIVHLGSGDGALTAALRGAGFLVHGLERDPAAVEKARAHIRSLGLYGPVSVERWRGGWLPYIDGLANLIVVEDLEGLSMDEVLRVVVPGGTACLRRDGRWTKTVKPRPPVLDDWTHALHDATGNAVSNDTLVAPPYHMQWIGAPGNARHHESLASVTAVVSASGRLYSIVDEAPAASILLPPRWSLVARDAFNGVILWRRSIPAWEPYLRSFRSGPPELSRRLVAEGDRVYVTLGLGAAVEALDAATGATAAMYEGTRGTEEILYQDSTLFVVVGVEDAAGGAPEAGAGAGHAGGRKEPEGRDASGRPRKDIAALDAATGQTRWRRLRADPLPLTLAAGGGRIFYLDARGPVALDARTGEELWRSERAVALQRPGWSAPTLVVHGDVVLCADREPAPAPDADERTGERLPRWLAAGGAPGDLVAHAARTGEVLWSCRSAETYHAPIDVFVSDGLVWVGESRARQGPDFTRARDLWSGEIERRISPARAFETTMPHHRCYRNRATRRFIVTGRTGVELIDLRTGEAFRHHWIRGVCQYGVVPANGLLYVPPHSCACFVEAKLTGFLALAPARLGEGAAAGQEESSGRLEKGPAFPALEAPGPAGGERDREGAGAPGDRARAAAEWPTYRHDGARSGCTESAVPAGLSVLWEARPGGRLTSPVVAAGMALVATVDGHTVSALDVDRGEPLWRYTAGGRIDSPPTIAEGLAVFGAADGWVHCVSLAGGTLAWRFRAAPEDRRLVARGQVESVWPVHGSVLVDRGAVTCAAGRSSYLDGGIRLLRLDLKTGCKLAEERIWSRDAETGEQPGEPMMFEMPGALPDVLSTDGELLFMRHLSLDPVDLRRRSPRQHLYSPAGFLDGDWWHRSYWVLGEHFYSGYIGWYFAGREVPAGRLLVVDRESVYGFSYRPEFYRGATGRRYQLFRADREEQPAPPPADYRRASRDYPPRGEARFRVKYRWSREVPLLVRAMVRAGDKLFLAGPPEGALRSAAAFSGEEGGVLCVVSTRDGSTVASYRLDGLPVFDGMAAAGGRLYVSLEDGCLLCLGEGPGRRALERRAGGGG